MAHEFLSCVQKALLSAGYDNILLKVKQVIWLEILYLKKDLIAVLPTGYGKSLVFQVLPRLLRERDARSASTRASASVIKSVVLVVSPLNALMCDQIFKLKEKGVEAAVLGVKEGKDADLIRRLFRLSGKELVNVLSRPDTRLFSVIRRLFLS